MMCQIQSSVKSKINGFDITTVLILLRTNHPAGQDSDRFHDI